MNPTHLIAGCAAIGLPPAAGRHADRRAPSCRRSTAERRRCIDSIGHPSRRGLLLRIRRRPRQLGVSVTGLTPGEHGMHVHETGTCTPPKFESAGATSIRRPSSTASESRGAARRRYAQSGRWRPTAARTPPSPSHPRCSPPVPAPCSAPTSARSSSMPTPTTRRRIRAAIPETRVVCGVIERR